MSNVVTTRFRWIGKNLKGQAVDGESEAVDIKSLYRILYSQGILVTTAKKIRPATPSLVTRKHSAAGMAIFLRQCASLLSAGLPLTHALDICIDSAAHPAFKHELRGISDQVANGSSFCSALRGSSLGQDRLLMSLIHVAEQAGTLDVMMEKLARDSEKAEQLRARVKKALMYPMAVLIVAVVVTVLLLVNVVPQFAQTFSDLGAELPSLTRWILMLSDLVIKYAFITLILTFVFTLAVKLSLRRYRNVRFWKDTLVCHIPITGAIVQHACLARFCQILGISLKAGVPLLQALQSSAAATGNLVYERACHDLAELINQGQTLSFGIRKSACFPVMIGQLIDAGEQSGTLDQMLDNCANRYEQSLDNAVDKLSSLIEPVIMTVLGIIIATLLLAMYLPVFRLGAVL